MKLMTIVLLFGGGIAVGLLLPPLVRLVNVRFLSGLVETIVGTLAAPFRRLGDYLRKRADYRRASGGGQPEAAAKVDPREQQLSDSAQAVRVILLSLTSLIQRADQAATVSTATLDDVRATLDAMHLPPDLAEVHEQLRGEIDRMVTTNSTLREELARSRDILEIQRQQIESLKTEVRSDGLTQLGNRPAFDEKLAEMIRLYQRYNDPFSLLMVDVDNFKEINDTHGHQAGDRILKGVAFKLKSCVRDSDFIARYGGDEFALILIKASVTAAADVGRKLCRTLQESRFLLDGKDFFVTLSIGVAEAVPGDTSESLLARADAALYRVKQEGRNGVAVAPPP
jgi:diguanylate cyclase